jgi:hypothetical protein
MRHFSTVLCFTALAVCISACAVDPADDQAETEQAQTGTPSASAGSPADTANTAALAQAADPQIWAIQPQSCIQETPPACIADFAICGARCCDGLLFRSQQFCGNCRTWATGACLSHGGWIRINWTF